MAFCIIPGKQPSGEASQVVRERFYRGFLLLTSLNPTLMQTQKTKSCTPRVLPGSDKGEISCPTQNTDGAGGPGNPGVGLARGEGAAGRRQQCLVGWSGQRLFMEDGPELHICQSGVSRMLTCLSQN